MKKCKFCGEKFEPSKRHPHQIYCNTRNTRCREKDWLNHHKDRVRKKGNEYYHKVLKYIQKKERKKIRIKAPLKTCKVCGKKFQNRYYNVPTRNLCSNKCRSKYFVVSNPKARCKIALKNYYKHLGQRKYKSNKKLKERSKTNYLNNKEHYIMLNRINALFSGRMLIPSKEKTLIKDISYLKQRIKELEDIKFGVKQKCH